MCQRDHFLLLNIQAMKRRHMRKILCLVNLKTLRCNFRPQCLIQNCIATINIEVIMIELRIGM